MSLEFHFAHFGKHTTVLFQKGLNATLYKGSLQCTGGLYKNL